MNQYAKVVKRRLDNCIEKLFQTKDEYVKRPGKDFTRVRTLPFKKLIELVVTMGAHSQGIELLNYFQYDENTPTSSSLIQQRDKLKPEAFLQLLHDFTQTLRKIKKFKGYRLLAVDGSKTTIPTNPNDYETHVKSNPNSKGYNLLNVNALYDLCNRIYLDATIQTYRKHNEFKALIQMVTRLTLNRKVIVVADRGYESYNNIVHIENKGWNYVIRVKAPDCGKGFLKKTNLPVNQEFDEMISVLMTRRHTNEVKSQPKLYRFLTRSSVFDFLSVGDKGTYPISYRVVCVKIDEDNYQYLITNLDANRFSTSDLKDIYKLRWGIETSFRHLKHTLGLLYFHSKKAEHIRQEIFARMVLYNYCEMVTLDVVIKQDSNRKYTYQVNFTKAVSICIEFLRRFYDKHPPNVEELIKRFILPIRKDRNFPRSVRTQPFKVFIYRVA